MFGGFRHVIRVNGPFSPIFQSTLKMGQSVTIKPQNLLDVLYLGHIEDTIGHFIGIIRGSTIKT